MCPFLFQVDKSFTASCESKVTPLTIAVFLKYSSGKIIVTISCCFHFFVCEN